MPTAPTSAHVQLVVCVEAPHADLVSGLLWIDGPMAIEERPGAPGQVELVAGFPSRHEADVAAANLARRARATPTQTEVIDADDESWRDAWRPFARPVRVGTMLVRPVGTSNGRPPPGDAAGGADIVLDIDPGRAFSAGSHPTTRLMLAALLDVFEDDAPTSVLDVGCGSGVLAIAAARLGADRVTAVDIDPEAIAATEANAARNLVADRVACSATALAAVPDRFDLVLANLLAPTIIELADALTAHVSEGGRLVVSGLLAEQWVGTVFHLDRWYVEAVTVDDGWAAVRLSR